MEPQCISRSCWCSSWPLLDIGPKWAGKNQLFTGTTTLVSLPTMVDPILQEPSRVLLHQRPRGALILHVGGLGCRGCGPRTGSCCCSCCRSAISAGEARWSGPPRTASVPDSSTTLSQCLPTAPLHCLPVPPDSSATLSPGRCVSSTFNPARSCQVCRGVGEKGRCRPAHRF